ncbi:MAG: hypothetical protein ACR2P8_11035 [Myxococcota bacterium]
MCRGLAYVLPLLLLSVGVGNAEEPIKEKDKLLSGMSIVGNDDAPKSLVIVPWKASDLGDTLDVSRMLDDGRRPVDRDVFMRELDYYQIREGTREGPEAVP